MRAPCYAPCRSDGRDIPRDALSSAELGMARAHTARKLVKIPEAVAGVAPRPPMRAAPGIGCVHIVGAGLAGLAAAVRLADASRSVVLHEAAPHAGGRCRS